MIPGGLGEAEIERLAALHRLEVLDTPPEQDFDDVVALARALTGAEAALVSLVDEARQWFKARAGTDLTETARDIAFCDHVVRTRDVVVVADALQDARFRDNPLVTGEPFIRFYAGAPIVTPDGHVLGAVSVMDPRPRPDFEQADALAALARQAAALLRNRRRLAHEQQAQAALARELDRFWTLAHDLILICDLEGTVVAANPAWRAVFGELPERKGGVQMRGFLADPTQRPDLSDIADGGVLRVSLDYRGHDGGARTISWTLRREGGLIYGIGRDDTALRAAEQDLAQAQKMESLGQLTGGIAHDFNNLLTIIVGNLDIARRRLDRGDLPRVARALGEAGDGAGRAATLTQRLLAFARRQRLAPRAVAPAALLADMRPLLERAASEVVAVDVVIEQDVWAAEVDPGQLESAILNLAVNGRDAMAGLDRPGRLTIGASNAPVDAALASRERVAAGDFVRFTVADTGAGMSPDVLARALEPFFTTKGVGRGTGLGLSQVEGFVRQSGGFLSIATVPNEGTAVSLWLPRSAAEPVEPTVTAACDTLGARAVSILVVEDNDALRELIVETLREAGYRVIEAHDGRAALSLLSRQATPPELVLSDVMMPALDGFQLAAEVRRRLPATRVLLMSGYAGAAAELDGSGERLLVKPFTSAGLLERVAQAVEIPAI